MYFFFSKNKVLNDFSQTRDMWPENPRGPILKESYMESLSSYTYIDTYTVTRLKRLGIQYIFHIYHGYINKYCTYTWSRIRCFLPHLESDIHIFSRNLFHSKLPKLMEFGPLIATPSFSYFYYNLL